MTTPPTAAASNPAKRWVWRLVKLLLLTAVIVFVGRQAWIDWRQLREHPVTVSWGWLALAFAVSVWAWLPSIVYWRQLIVSLGHFPPWPQTVRAYFCGHLGKYIPGKASVLIIRSMLLAPEGVPPLVGALTAAYETLAYMASGAIAVAMLSPWLFSAGHTPEWAGFLEHPWLKVIVPLAVIAGSVAAMTLLSAVMNRLVKKLLPAALQATGPAPRIRSVQAIRGLLILLAAWWVHGLCLGLVIQALNPGSFEWRDWPLWTATTALANVIGFACLFAPGGLVVREAVYTQMLAPAIGAPQALIVGLLMRIISLLGEVVVSGVLYVAIRPSSPRLTPDE